MEDFFWWFIGWGVFTQEIRTTCFVDFREREPQKNACNTVILFPMAVSDCHGGEVSQQ